MEAQSKLKAMSRLALFSAALIWGSSFFIVKNTVDVFPTYWLLASRFIIACTLLSIIFFKKLKQLNKSYFINGGIIGLCLFCAYSFQTFGIAHTSPGKNAFLTAVYCVIVPFLFWIVDKSKPDIYNFLAAGLCLCGIGLVSLTGDFSIGIGDFLTLIGGFFYASHMVSVAKLSRGKDPVLVTIVQFGFTGTFALIAALFTESLPTSVSAASLSGILYLAVFCTATALLLQNIGQKNTPPAAASIILSLEAVFGIIFSMIFYGERLTPRLACGFLIIFCAVIVSETKLAFLRKTNVVIPTVEVTPSAVCGEVRK
ncbi:MAG: DMT family transporter [Oscillospiraceae bacterium]